MRHDQTFFAYGFNTGAMLIKWTLLTGLLGGAIIFLAAASQ